MLHVCAGEKGEESKCYMCVLERRVRGLSVACVCW